MFTGLVEAIGQVERVATGAMTNIWINPGFSGAELMLGESIACDGVCLTVVEVEHGRFRVQASAETARCSTVGEWRTGTRVNLERALKMGDRLGGHWVLGHVDAATTVLEKKNDGGALVMSFALPRDLAALVIEKGSVAVDGISLTVNMVTDERFAVALIPETQRRTTLAEKPVGARVNLEVDVIGKYVERLLSMRLKGGLEHEAKPGAVPDGT